ncbi:DAK2 domain-containing protein [Facklamia sp. DSM 111018]|uniref:DAK2 domain-containing protein n=1 Tax=Facklamia lactis TaxID=2749967 RepID=A0ABS0LQ74_9LACT|nr:DAK2 domain-containing protein [Facklamia lactis]MBG9979804.1 DAK2 domain-containing protein [Facklamia lactis]MBG9985516.1 DAK2 domain-containing protein [Facklamia lactis]
MELKIMKSSEFKQMFNAGAERLAANVDLVNSLNVFPVPDGDTGTNMNMSFQSGVEKMRSNSSLHVGELAGSVAKGLLMGARGNSGVILSQIFRGFSQAIKDEENLDGTAFAQAFMGGVESAYKAVMKPVEGTILTVARESAIRGEKKAQKTDDIIEIMRSIVRGAQESLDKTPDLLPVLKQVGVVDSGGKGLLCIYEGFLAALTGEVIEDEKDTSNDSQHAHAIFDEMNEHPMSMEDITFGFCTEIMVRIGQGEGLKKTFDYEEFRHTLDQKGDSLLVVADDEIVKVHIHTENPGEIMQLGQEFGELIKIKVDNMREQVRALEGQEEAIQSKQAKSHHTKEYAIIGVASGQGLIELFESIGVDYVIAGGQTMNPSTEDFIKAIETVNAHNIILLPNNKNIVMAAEQAAEVSEVPTKVVPTRSINQGIAAMLMFNPEQNIDENQIAMTEYIATVSSGQITHAIRDTEIDGLTIKENDFMGILDGDIVYADPSLETVLSDLIKRMLEDDSELVTIIIGENGEEEVANSVAEALSLENSDLEFEFIQGDQPVYNYFVTVD